MTAKLGRLVRIGSVQLNPFTFSATISVVEVETPDGRGTVAGWDRLYLNFDVIGLLSGEWAMSDIALDGFHAEVAVQPDGSLNISDLLERFIGPSFDASSSGWQGRPVRVRRLQITQARIAFTDRSRPREFHAVINPIDFTLRGFRAAGPPGAVYRLEATTDAGERFSWNGTITAAPFTSAGEWEVENLPVANYAPYFENHIAGRITGGLLNASGHYDVSLAPRQRHVLVQDGAAAVKNLRIVEPGHDEPVIALSSVEASGITADALEPRGEIRKVQMQGGQVTVRRDAGGVIELPGLLRPRPVETPDATTGRPLKLSVHEIAWRDFAFTWHDLAAPRPVRLQLADADGTLKNFSPAPGTAVPADITFGLVPQGRVHLSGVVMIEPQQADLDVDVTKLPLAPLSPYFEPWCAARVSDGTLSVQGHAKIAADGNGAPTVDFSGSGRMQEIALADPASGAEIAGFDSLALDAVKLRTAPRLALSIQDVKLDAPYVNATRAKPARASAAGAGSPTSADTVGDDAAPEIAVAQATVTGGALRFTDETSAPPVGLSLQQVRLRLENFSSAHPEQGRLDGQALVNGASQGEVHGRLGLRKGKWFADVTVGGAPADLQPIAPYVAKYAGFELEQGELSFASHAEVSGGSFQADTTLTLENLSLGAATGSPEAVKLPVRLGLALLEDANGKIVLHLPVRGTVGNPDFRFGESVGQAFTAVLTKAASSPFALLGSMFGGGGEELGEQDFMPGTTELTADSERRLATLRRALAGRPALKLAIEGDYSVDADTPALKRAKLEELVRERVQREQARGSGPPEAAAISADDRAKALTALFAEKFAGSGEAEAAKPAAEPTTAPSPAATTEPVAPAPSAKPEPHRGLLGRAWDTVTLKPVRRRIGRMISHVMGHETESERESKPSPEAASPPDEPQEQKLPRQPAAAIAGGASELSPDDMEQRLVAAMDVTPGDLRALAAARARRVREQLLAGGIEPERVAVANAVAQSGSRVTLHLQ
ncbi:MAG TPA: DUF748 domain-containing protein [Opitutus sp.]|nr:DUF748 domain-containing protein [Opitutus sp.]